MPHQPLYLSRDEVRRVDLIATERFGMPGIVLMENAALTATAVALEMLASPPRHVLILCGGGNNGGDGLAMARHLSNLGYVVDIALTINPARYIGDALTNWRITQAMQLPSRQATPDILTELPRPALIVDAVFGTGLAQAPRPPFASLAETVNQSGIPILAVDVPSGLDCDTGQPLGACIRATRTITFVASKKGFASLASREWTGLVTVGDIGCPRQAIAAAVECSPS